MDKIDELLTRGVEKIYPSKEELEDELNSGKKLKIYHGIDPTGDLHIGHMVSLRKLRQFQDEGHEIIVLVGDFTATIGDPTDKKATRQPLTPEQVLQNTKDYRTHIGKILDLGKSNVRFLHNEEWTNKLKPMDLLKIASQFTVARLLERDMFQERIKEGKDIGVHEFLYPIFQAYDSVTMDVDMQIGGNDQTFNMLAGRDLMRRMKTKNKFVMAMSLLSDAQGTKIGKTEGNAIALADNPSSIFAKLMALPDNIIAKALELLTDIPIEEIEDIRKKIESGENPISFKKKLAFEIVKQLHNQDEATKAQEEFENTVQSNQTPTSIPTIEFKRSFISTASVTAGTVAAGLASSNSEAKTVINQGGVSINNEKLKDPHAPLSDYLKDDEVVMKRGPFRAAKLKPAPEE